MENSSKRNVKSLPPGWCLVGLATCALIVFFVGTRLIPAATELFALIDKYPAMIADPRTWFLLATLALWGTQALICGVLVQAYNKRLVAALYDDE